MTLPPATATNIQRYSQMIYAVKDLVERQNMDNHEGISAILFEAHLGLEKISEELSKLEAEDFKKKLQKE